MTNIRVISEFTTRPLPAKPGSAIDESLACKIESINNQIKRIQQLPNQAGRVRLLKNEIIMLRDQLLDIRDCTKTDQV